MARTFDAASTQYAEKDVAPVTAAPFTVWARVKANGASGVPHWFFIGDKDVEAQYFGLVLRNLSGTLTLEMQTRAVSIQQDRTSNNWTYGTWHTACGIWTSSTSRRVVLDGDWANSATSTTSLAPSGADRLSLGRLGDSTPFQDGSVTLADVVVYSVALAQSEVEALHEGANPLRIRPITDIADYWPLYGVSSPEIDYSPSGNSLTLVSSPPAADHAPVASYSRRWWGGVPLIEAAAGGGGLSIPVAMASYRRRRV